MNARFRHGRVGYRRGCICWRCYTAAGLDPVAVERFMAGRHATIPLRRRNALNPDLVEAIRRMTARGIVDREISERLAGRMSPQAVLKARSRYGIRSPLARAAA